LHRYNIEKVKVLLMILSTLDDDVLSNITSYLSHRDMRSMQYSCRRYQQYWDKRGLRPHPWITKHTWCRCIFCPNAERARTLEPFITPHYSYPLSAFRCVMLVFLLVICVPAYLFVLSCGSRNVVCSYTRAERMMFAMVMCQCNVVHETDDSPYAPMISYVFVLYVCVCGMLLLPVVIIATILLFTMVLSLYVLVYELVDFAI